MNGETMSCSRGEGAHIHGTGFDKGDRQEEWHQHGEWARCGKNLLAALLCRWQEGVSECKWEAPEGMLLNV